MVENSKAMGEVLVRELEWMKEEHPCVGDVKGKGLFAAIELVKDNETKERLVSWTVEYYEKNMPLWASFWPSSRRRAFIVFPVECADDPQVCITEQELIERLEKIDKALSLVDRFISTT